MNRIFNIILSLFAASTTVFANTSLSVETEKKDSVDIVASDSVVLNQDSAIISKIDTVAKATVDSAPAFRYQTEVSPSKRGPKDSMMYFSWRADGPLGLPVREYADSTLDKLYIANMADKNTLRYADHSSLGSPGISLIYADRIKKSDFFFFTPYEANYTSPDDILYYNTRKPYSKFWFIGAGPSNRSDQCVGGLFTVNAGSKFNFGMYGDWVNSYGAYESSSTRNCNAGFFGSYMGLRSNLMMSIGFAKFENYESGGFLDESYITSPERYGNPADEAIPVYFTGNTFSKLHGYNMHLNYKYHLGFEKEYKVNADSVIVDYVPVTSFIADMKYESDWKRYTEKGTNSFHDTFYNASAETRKFMPISTMDSVLFRQFKGNFGVTLNEEFNKLMKFGLAGYYTVSSKTYHYADGLQFDYRDAGSEFIAENELKEVELEDGIAYIDSVGYRGRPNWNKNKNTKMGVGAVLSKHSGKHLFFNVIGEYYFVDEKQTGTSYLLKGDVNTKFEIGKQPVSLGGKVELKNECPDYFEDHYYSNYFNWDNDFDNKRSLSIDGLFEMPKIGFSAKIGYYNIDNHIYFNEQAMPVQTSDAVNVFYLGAEEKLKFGIFHWDNGIAYQTTSDQYIMPLPTFVWNSNVYLRTPPIFKKSLTFQVGAELNYHTSFYAQKYNPATGMLYVQREKEYGDYPLLNVYGQAQLKVLKMFIVWNHVNQKMGNNSNYMISPGYAMSPSFLRVGISVTFDD
ncbi:MAG: putative porin [Paludibacteraceae bacterium]|nr:putative porin [Paludibacteraceae bacterium]